jgi:hypothetical protein
VFDAWKGIHQRGFAETKCSRVLEGAETKGGFAELDRQGRLLRRLMPSVLQERASVKQKPGFCRLK